MFPVRDTVSSRNHPIVNNAIIGVNVVLFLVELSQGGELSRFIYTYGLVPARYSIPQISSYFSFGQQILSLFSFMFIHGGFWHLLGNMWFLYIFGDNVEDRLGHLRYLAFYVACGLASGLFHLAFNIHSNMPAVGASGAIAGVMGAYFILYPHAKILTLVPVIVIPFFFELPAYFFLGFWFVIQMLSAAGSHGNVSGIAWWAHIGGFVFGILFLKLFLALPGTLADNRIRRMTARKKSPRLQVIRPVGLGDDPDLYGVINITPYESQAGARKLVNIPWGFHKRLYNILIPPGTVEGSKLRLAGLGKQMANGQKGDMFLKVIIQ